MDAIQIDIHRKTSIEPGHGQDCFGFCVLTGQVSDRYRHWRQFAVEEFLVSLPVDAWN